MKAARPARRVRGAAPRPGARRPTPVTTTAGCRSRPPSTRCSSSAERVGGEHVRVTSLTKPGVEPHDLELTPRAVGSLADAAAVVYLAGFQPAVDEAVRTQAADAAVDVTPAARLTLTTAAGHADPHFWLDPTRLADVADGAGRRLRPARPGQRRRLPRQRGGARRRPRRARRRVPHGPGAVPHPRARHRPRGLRLPRRALRPAPGGGRRREPRHRAGRRDAARPQRPRARRRRHDGLLREPGLPRARRDRRPRGRRPGGRARPARGHHRRLARAATTSR